MVHFKLATRFVVGLSLLLLTFNNCSSGFNSEVISYSSTAASSNGQQLQNTSPHTLPGLPVLTVPVTPPQLISKTMYACDENIVLTAKGTTATLKGCDQGGCYAELTALPSSADLGNAKWTRAADGSYSFVGRNTNKSATDIIQLWAVEDENGHKSTAQVITMKACSVANGGGSTGGGSSGGSPSSPLTPPPAAPPTQPPTGRACPFNISDYNKYGLTEFFLRATTLLADGQTTQILSAPHSYFVDACYRSGNNVSGTFAQDSLIYTAYQADSDATKSTVIKCEDGTLNPSPNVPYIRNVFYGHEAQLCPNMSYGNTCSVVNQHDQFTSYLAGDSVSSFQLNLSNGGFNPDNLETYFACQHEGRIYKVMRGYRYICTPTGGASAILQKNGFTFPEIMDETAYLQNLNPLGTPDISSYPTCASKSIDPNSPFKISRDQDRSGSYSSSNGHSYSLEEIYREGKILITEGSDLYRLDHLFLETEKNSEFMKSFKGRGIEFPAGCYQAAPYSAQATWTNSTTLQITKTYLEKSCGFMKGSTATVTIKK